MVVGLVLWRVVVGWWGGGWWGDGVVSGRVVGW